MDPLDSAEIESAKILKFKFEQVMEAGRRGAAEAGRSMAMRIVDKIFEAEDNPHSLRGIAYECDDSNAQYFRLLGAEALIQAAQLEPDPDQANEDFAFADSILKSIVAAGRSKPRIPENYDFRSQVLQTYIPVYKKLSLDRVLPDETEQHTVQSSLRSLAPELNETLKCDQDSVSHTRIVGFTAEYFVLNLLTRYSNNNFTDSSWFPIPTLISQDGKGGGKERKEGWDISVFTDVGNGPKLGYQIQVKARRGKEKYSKGISVINVVEDLIMPSIDPKIIWSKLPNFFYYERQSPRIGDILDNMTELLLEKIG